MALTPAAGEKTPRSRRRRRLRPLGWGVLAALILSALLAGLWFLLPIRTVTVSGNRFLTRAQVLALAGLTAPFYGSKRPSGWLSGGWLYYGGWRAAGLRASPWVASARIVRRFPGSVGIQLMERTPAARWQQPDGSVYTVAPDGTRRPGAHRPGRVVTLAYDGQERVGSDPAGRVVVIAWDGTVLPGADPHAGPNAGLPLLSGWGPDRLPDLLRAALLLSGYNVLSVRSTPSGITVQTSKGTVWSGSMDSLLKYAGSVKMFANRHINLYPWGVSVQQ